MKLVAPPEAPPEEAPGKHAFGCVWTFETAEGEQPAPSYEVVMSTMGCTTLAREGVGEAVREGDAPTDKLGAADGATLMVADCDAAAPELHEMIDGVGSPLEPGEAVHASCATEVEKGAPVHTVPR